MSTIVFPVGGRRLERMCEKFQTSTRTMTLCRGSSPSGSTSRYVSRTAGGGKT